MAEEAETQFSIMSLEDELICSICLSTFDCLETISCGHNFCQDCLLESWKDSYSCPQCRTVFATKPELKKYTVLTAIVETFKERSHKSEASLSGEASEAVRKDVLCCDTCMEAGASKTCLTCMASYCEEHLRPHRENPIFRLHQLSEPVGDLLELICTDHHKLMELFCPQHDRPICSFCLQQIHRGCSFVTLEEQRSLKESDLRNKLGLLNEKMEKTETVVFQMNNVQSKLKDAANIRKTALAAVYQQMTDLLAQDEREAQNEVDRELELGQMKLQDLAKKLNENCEKMGKTREDINSLLSESQTSTFLQASIELPKVIKFEPHVPRINLDSKKVTATQAFAAALRETLMEMLNQPVEARLLLLKPEFQPGVPWKGIDRVDPESDPYMTPGSMMGNAVPPSLNDTEHQLLQDNTDSTPPLNTLLPSPGAWPYSASDSPLNNAHNSAKYTEYKTSWPPEPIGPKSWKASRGSSQAQLSRPPPGLASQKQPSPSPWSGGGPRLAGRSWSSGSNSTGSTWSDGSSRESCWLVLSNLTPQIDGSTLRTICMQHGPLLTFHLGLTQGTALIRYGSRQEAAKAQSALHMCVLGNTTILAEFMSEEDVARYIAHSQAGGAGSGGTAAGSPGSGPTATSTVGANSNGGSCERGGAGGNGGVGGVEGASTGGVGSGGAGSSSSGWQSLESTGSSSDQSATQGPSLGIFTQWSTNGTGIGEAGRQGLWGGVGGMGGMGGAGYPSSSLWASPALEDRHQMGSPASLLPGDLLGGGADSI